MYNSPKSLRLRRVMKKDWNSHIGATNPIDVTPAKPAPKVSNPGAGVQSFALKSVSWENACIPASAGMTKSLAIFRRFSHQRTLLHHPVGGQIITPVTYCFYDAA